MGGHLVPPFEAYSGDEPYVFISYAHKDSEFVFDEISILHDAGYNIWYDEGIEASNEWPEEIANAVIGCAAFLVFVSPRSTASVNCRNEINLALNENKPFLAVHLEESSLLRVCLEDGRSASHSQIQASPRSISKKSCMIPSINCLVRKRKKRGPNLRAQPPLPRLHRISKAIRKRKKRKLNTSRKKKSKSYDSQKQISHVFRLLLSLIDWSFWNLQILGNEECSER